MLKAKKPLRVILVCGARPNFMKIAPIWRELKKNHIFFNPKIVHTGQHYTRNLSSLFFEELGLPEPDVDLGVGSGTQAAQTARIMLKFENYLAQNRPDLVVVVGDVNSTLACSLVASKLKIPLAHVEAGLRSFDRTMPEEINRTVTDALSDFLFVSEESGIRNLKQEGVPSKKIYFVGNVMIDTLLANINRIKKSNIADRLSEKHEILRAKNFALLTLHRPSNVDSEQSLLKIHAILRSSSEILPIIYPIHPRAKKMISRFHLNSKFRAIKNLLIIPPLGYIDFMKLVMGSKLVLTDSGGIQEETTFLNIPCVTLRKSTERPVTIEHGTNSLVAINKAAITKKIRGLLGAVIKIKKPPRFWDGKTAERIVSYLRKNLDNS